MLGYIWAGLTLALVIGLARKRRGRKRGRNFVAIPFSVGVSLLTLGNNTVVKTPALTLGEDLFLISVDMSAHTRGLTADEGEPLECGFAHGDLSITEVEEALQAEVSDPDDIIAKEHARRPVRRAGQMIRHGSDTTALALAGGATQRVTAKFSVGDGHGIDFWVANRSGAGLTTGAVTNFTGTIYGRWQR